MSNQQMALGNFMRLWVPGSPNYRFQNFWVGESVNHPTQNFKYDFMPFAFSGVSYNRSGENSQTELVFPNKELVRNFVDRAVKGKWICIIDTCLITDIGEQSSEILFSYTGQVSGSTWKDADLMLTLSSVLDAVTANVPSRNFDAGLVGPLPISGNASL